MPECPDTIEDFEEQIKTLHLCRRTLYNQAKARIETGAAKSVSEASRQLANETGRSAATIRDAIITEDKNRTVGLPQLSGTDKHRPFATSDLSRLDKAFINPVREIQSEKRNAKEAVRETRREENRVKVATVEHPEAIIEAGAKFATIVIDPPWDWGDEGDVNQMGRAKPDYATMSIDQIAGLPVADLADIDCHLYCWITNRSLPKGFALLDKWNFRFITVLTWVKPSFGLGNYFRGQTEHVLFGVKGSQMLKRKDIGTVFHAPRGPNGHSSKPEEFYQIVETCSPGPYLEMFSRVKRSGWNAWGEGD